MFLKDANNFTVNKASTLTTARTINGTSFNGSANITTANWGTARNIYIADSSSTNTSAAVSVNGSGNVTLKLPATIKASLTGNASTSSKWASPRAITASGDVSGSTSIDGSANVSLPLTLTTTGVTAGTYGPGANATLGFGGTFTVPQYTVDAKGRITGSSTRTFTMPNNPNSDTKVTNTLATTTKAYVTGTTSATTSTGTQVFDTGVYLDTTAGRLVASTFAGALSGNASTATKLQTDRTINDVTFNGTSNITIGLKTFTSTVNNDNTKNYHHILSTGVCTGDYIDKVITVMASANYSGGNFGIFRATFRTNNSSGTATCDIEWIVRKGFGSSSICYNLINTHGGAVADIFYKSSGTYAGVTFTVLGEGARGSKYDNNSWTKYSTSPTSNVYTEAEMKVLKSYTHTLVAGKDVATVSSAATCTGNSATATTLATARTINGTSFNGSANITTANWGTARTITIGATGKSVNGGGNYSWSASEILAGQTVGYGNFGGLFIERTGSTNGSSIGFKNSNGTLGYIGMNTVNGGLTRWSADTNSQYTVLDTGNYKTHVTPANIGAAASSHTHSYLPLSGGTLTGALTATELISNSTGDYSNLKLNSNGASRCLLRGLKTGGFEMHAYDSTGAWNASYTMGNGRVAFSGHLDINEGKYLNLILNSATYTIAGYASNYMRFGHTSLSSVIQTSNFVQAKVGDTFYKMAIMNVGTAAPTTSTCPVGFIYGQY